MRNATNSKKAKAESELTRYLNDSGSMNLKMLPSILVSAIAVGKAISSFDLNNYYIAGGVVLALALTCAAHIPYCESNPDNVTRVNAYSITLAAARSCTILAAGARIYSYIYNEQNFDKADFAIAAGFVTSLITSRSFEQKINGLLGQSR